MKKTLLALTLTAVMLASGPALAWNNEWNGWGTNWNRVHCQSQPQPVAVIHTPQLIPPVVRPYTPPPAPPRCAPVVRCHH